MKVVGWYGGVFLSRLGDLNSSLYQWQTQKNVRIEAYSLDSLKTFDRFHISHEVAWKGCSTEEGFIRTVMPFITRIDKRLDNLDDDGWKTVFRDEYISAIAQCGARNKKEAKLLEDFKKRK